MKITDYDLERVGTTFLWAGVLVVALAIAGFVSAGVVAVLADVKRDDAMMKLCEAGRDEACRAIGPPGLVVREK